MDAITDATRNPQERLLVDLRTAAGLLGLSPRTVWALTAEGDLPCARVGRRLLYSPEALRHWVHARQVLGHKAR